MRRSSGAATAAATDFFTVHPPRHLERNSKLLGQDARPDFPVLPKSLVPVASFIDLVLDFTSRLFISLSDIRLDVV